jgi:hypothetical protein
MPLAAFPMFSARQGCVGDLGVFAVIATGAAGCASAPDGSTKPLGTSAEAITGAVGDWMGFTNGQSVVGVYSFYAARNGVHLTATCIQPTDIGNCATRAGGWMAAWFAALVLARRRRRAAARRT